MEKINLNSLLDGLIKRLCIHKIDISYERDMETVTLNTGYRKLVAGRKRCKAYCLICGARAEIPYIEDHEILKKRAMEALSSI